MRVKLCQSIVLVLSIFGFVASQAAATDGNKFGAVPLNRTVNGALNALPLFFEENQGQADPQVKFLSRNKNYVFFLLPGETVLALHSSVAPKRAQKALPGVGTRALLRTRFVGANQQAEIVALGALPGKSNYFMGNNPKAWTTEIPHYAKVSVQDIYPGIDLVYYSNEGRMEYDFIVSPGADSGRIHMAFSGMEALSIDGQGNLVLDTPVGDLIQSAPRVYQEGPYGREKIPATFVRIGAEVIGFQVAQYDTQRPLVIDPILDFLPDRPVYQGDLETPQILVHGPGFFSSFLGGDRYDGAYDIAVDGEGSAYVTGFTGSVDFPGEGIMLAEPGEETLNVFVSKLNAAGDTLLYSTYFGGNAASGRLLNMGVGIALDEAGQAYVTGVTTSDDFPVVNPFQARKNDGADGFVAKLNATGDALLYSTYLGGKEDDWGLDIAIGVFGHAYVTGMTSSTDFPLENPFQNALSGSKDAFVTKLDEHGSALVYSTYLGGGIGTSMDIVRESDSKDVGAGIAVDANGQAHVTGITGSGDFPTSTGALQPQIPHVPAAGSYAFVTKLNDVGDDLLYSTYLGGGSDDEGRDIALDSAGNAYITGYTASTDFPLSHPAQAANAGMLDGFVTKINPSGDTLVYSTFIGGEDRDQGFAIAVDSNGSAHVVGTTASNHFPKRRAFQAAFAGTGDAFVTSLNAAGEVRSSTYLGGGGYDLAWGVAEYKGNVYIAGQTQSSDFPTSPNAFDISLNGQSDAFVTKFGPILARPELKNSIQFSDPGYQLMEGRGHLSITVTRNGLSIGAASVDYATVNGSAIAGSDYIPAAGTLSFAPGEASKLIYLPILDDYMLEGDETLSIVLSHPTGGVALGDPNVAVVTISDSVVYQ